jgi:tRNA/rRNA methyltransferase
MARAICKNIVIILAGTKYPGNIGSVARSMNNFGLRELRLAAPQCEIEDDAYRMAKRGKSILEKAKTYRSLLVAARGLGFLVGTSAKTGGNRERAFAPRSLAPRLLAHAAQEKVGMVFGPEDTGLVDEDLLRCQMHMRIPTDPDSCSINVAHAVTILCYELFLASLKREPIKVPRLAAVEQVEAMYAQLEEALLEIGFLHPQNAHHMMFALRRFFGRAGLEATDVGILRGISRQIAWFAKNRKPSRSSC